MKNILNVIATVLLSSMAFGSSAFASKVDLAYFNESHKCGVIYTANEAFFRFDVLTKGASKKYTGVIANTYEEGGPLAGNFLSRRDRSRQATVPLSYFVGGSPLGDSFLIITKNPKANLYDYKRYDEAFSSSFFPKEKTLCSSMTKVSSQRARELIKEYGLNKK